MDNEGELEQLTLQDSSHLDVQYILASETICATTNLARATDYLEHV